MENRFRFLNGFWNPEKAFSMGFQKVSCRTIDPTLGDLPISGALSRV